MIDFMFISLFPSFDPDQALWPILDTVNLNWRQKWEFYLGGTCLYGIMSWQLSVNTEHGSMLWKATEKCHMTSCIGNSSERAPDKLWKVAQKWQAERENIWKYIPYGSDLLLFLWESKIKVMCLQVSKNILFSWEK